MNIDMNRKQFLGTVFATIASSCIPSFGSVEKNEFDKCKDDILYFVDNYLVVNDTPTGRLKMTPQQREYLKNMSETKDILVCAKGRQVGISTANNVFAYWKSIFFGPDHHVFIVEPSLSMCRDAQKMYWRVANSGFMPLPNRVHFVTPYGIKHGVNLNDCNNTYIFDEYEWWKDKADTSIAYEIYVRMNYGRWLERGQSLDGYNMEHSPIIISGTPKDGDASNFVFCCLRYFLHDSRYMVLPSPTTGLKA